MELDHVGIAVHRLDEALARYRQLGLQPGLRGAVEAFQVEVCFLHAGPSKLELLAPIAPESPIARFLERRGEGLHHLAFAVPRIEEVLRNLQAQGVQLIDERPRQGFGGKRIAFLHPRSAHGVLIELVEHP